MISEGESLLSANDPSPVRWTNPSGASMFLLVGDHAGNRIPERLMGLGLTEADRNRHIAIDIGVSRLGHRLAGLLDAAFVEQRYSRLVVDCNRAKASPGSIAEVSDGTVVAGNAGLTQRESQARYREVFDPYHAAIAAEIERREAEGQATVLIALHSFTPVLGDAPRPWDIGVLHDGGDTSLALALLDRLRVGPWCIGDNQPYRMDGTDYTVPAHAYARRLTYAEIEVRQDHLGDGDGVDRMASLLAAALTSAVGRGVG